MSSTNWKSAHRSASGADASCVAPSDPSASGWGGDLSKIPASRSYIRRLVKDFYLEPAGISRKRLQNAVSDLRVALRLIVPNVGRETYLSAMTPPGAPCSMLFRAGSIAAFSASARAQDICLPKPSTMSWRWPSEPPSMTSF